MHQEYEEKKGWWSRLERERRNLSASVEATLVDRRSQTYTDDEESYGQTGIFETAGGTPLVPPRLSLQSRGIATVHPGGFVESATSAQRIAQSSGIRLQPPDVQQLQQMATLAQSFTNDLARYGYDPALAATNPLPPVSQSVGVSASIRSRPSGEWPRLSGYNSVPAPFPSIEPSRLPPSQSVTRQRLGGRSTRIRLEVPSEEQIAARFAASQAPLSKQEVQDGYHSQEAPDPAGGHLPSLDLFRPGIMGTTSARLPVIDLVKNQLEASRRGLCGSSFFEAGQRDSIITNKHVTETCVVQVMFTDNPGPVVIHYVSLQPLIGFTIHLTAPTHGRAPFNYVIVLGE